ncbi:MAG: N-acetylmuramic acid 6-phosphate etherase [Candidatus Marinimicrobia bacterium]|nr:N-acetylmuramic acid 6-phosphate etherase [Candidatus Neomarinimicrobiota bacterium]
MENIKPKARKDLTTEKQNPDSHRIDKRSIPEILEIMNREDQQLALKVNAVLPEIAIAVELAVQALRQGGHIYYIGAGTSGRLGVLDASEIPPTFSAPRDWFQGIIAGGLDALVRSIEGAEDNPLDAEDALIAAGFGSKDLLVGIASSSATPYVVHALKWARSLGASTAYIICNPSPLLDIEVDTLIAVDVGPEILTGSTRLKSGTATKMVLNMISTTAMIQMGKVYGNLMVDLSAVNNKLVDRGSRIVEKLAEIPYEKAQEFLFAADKEVKTAIVMSRKNCSKAAARQLIAENDGLLRRIIGDVAGQ